MTSDTCVVCGNPVPEGRQLCPVCSAFLKKEKEPRPQAATGKKRKKRRTHTS